MLEDDRSITGKFDPSRFSNLIVNDIRHRAPDQPVAVILRRQRQAVIIELHYHVAAIPSEAMPHLFNLEGRYSSYVAEKK